MINLFDKYDAKAADLIRSLNTAGFNNQTVILNDDGFLFDGATSPVAFFTGMYDESETSEPKFFNEVAVPNYWEIKGSSQSGEIFEGYKKRGQIEYSNRGNDYRIIKEVKWYNDIERVRQVDMYNKFGKLFGKKTYSDGDLSLTSYFNKQQQEVILFNHITDTIQVMYQGKNYVFDSYIDFVIFYFDCAKLSLDSIYYNSLSIPFFIVDKLEANQEPENTSHVLFWQEESQEMPGNMRSIIDSEESLTKKIIVQSYDEFVRLQKQTDNQDILSYLGFIYDYHDNTNMNNSIFVLTNSDQVEGLSELVQELPGWQIHIAALTEMSSKLMDFERHENITLHPNTTIEEINDLSRQCSFYLDINHGNEVVNIIRQIFDNNKLIFAFDNTVHNKAFIDPQNIINHEQVTLLSDKLKNAAKNYADYKQALSDQRQAAGQATIAEYKRTLA
ncbi:glycosyltransferase stabilizing protein Gtf2 [Companilactobacillus sp. RD055328]|uniref:accessory Sec system glycosylation chaperone GtfB n=1 Tax=Companilactobacillus sp. RD055328 TaxID=2916634 RepID=UPI001FC8D1A3|nr:accessory Sec system glycosylation chaperone GtfB [Companilactobacillus sp. RD055328]GKQ42755.1 glycosyltransferase stabilizing protein Gtf2 [Companilactobacillus sp. RD055328]